MSEESPETQITREGPLHRLDGALATRGWATYQALSYDRSRIKAPRWRIKEWDYYLVNDGSYAVALTLSDLGYAGLVSASLIDFDQAAYKTTSVVTPFPMGRFRLPASSKSGVSAFENDRVSFRFEAADGVRTLSAQFAKFDGDDDLSFDAMLSDEPRDSMVISTPWADDPKAFYYNQKIVALRARGSFKKGLFVHGFSPKDSFGLLDWGRGVWTRDNTWYWAVAQGWQDGKGGTQADTHRFGLNLGYGFGDTTAASENMAFVDGEAHKLHRVTFEVPKRADATDGRKIADRFDMLKPWQVADDEGRLDLEFTPLLDRKDYRDFAFIRTDQHQVFGSFDGTVVLDDGTPFKVTGLQGSAEIVHNVY